MNSPVNRLKLASLFLIVTALLASYMNADAGHAKPPAYGQAWAGAGQVCQNTLPFPAGFDYPQTAPTVERWVSSRDEDRAREHGWYLWAGLNTGGANRPVWRSWCTSTQAFATGLLTAQAATARAVNRQRSLNAKRLADGPTTGEEPINLPDPPYYPVPRQVRAKYPQCYDAQQGQLVDGPTFQNNGDVMVAGVIYNDTAYRWIRNQRLYLASTLDRQVPPKDKTKQMAPMPAGSIVLKPMMWPVRGTGYTALPLWDDLPPSADEGRYAGFEIQKKWPRAVAVTARPQSQIARTSVTYLHGVYSSSKADKKLLGPITYTDAAVAPVQSFYHFSFPDLDRMNPCDRAILDASAYWAYNREFAKEDYLVLVAMHILTKEQPAWTFQSVWWHDKPNEGPYAADRPNIPASKAPGPWRNYLMASTYGITERPGGTKWPIAYNPYIELAADHPIATNCMNCHHRAAWPHKLSSYEVQSPGAPDALDVFSSDNPIFDGLLTVDSMWAVTDRAIAPRATRRSAAGRRARR